MASSPALPTNLVATVRIIMNTSSSTASGLSLSGPVVGRAMLAAIFLISGFGKLAAPAATLEYITSAEVPYPQLALAVAVLIELGCGVLLLIGYRTAQAAALLAAFSVASALIFHHALGDQNQLIHFLKNVAIAGGLLQVIALGAGAYSVDSHLATRNATRMGYPGRL